MSLLLCKAGMRCNPFPAHVPTLLFVLPGSITCARARDKTAGWCDEDVNSICAHAGNTPRNRGVWSIGAVGRCLSRQLAESKPLSTDCRRLVLAAAPKVLDSGING